MTTWKKYPGFSSYGWHQEGCDTDGCTIHCGKPPRLVELLVDEANRIATPMQVGVGSSVSRKDLAIIAELAGHVASQAQRIDELERNLDELECRLDRFQNKLRSAL